MTWLTNWNYRKTITVSNSGSSLTDYQIQVTIDTATLVSSGKILSNCNDIRVTNSDGSTLLYYWIESGCNTSSTKIWIKIPSILVETKTIYVYYGNATPPSDGYGNNGANTFIFYEDFESFAPDIAINTYTGWTQTGIVAIRTDYPYSGTKALRLNGANPWSEAILTLPAPITDNVVVEMSVRTSKPTSGGGDGKWAKMHFVTGTWSFQSYSFGRNFDGTENALILGDIGAASIDLVRPYIVGQYYRVKAALKLDTDTITVWGDGIITRTDRPFWVNISNFTKLYFAMYDYNNTGLHHLWIDNIVIRKYVATEPTTCAGGEEVSTVLWLSNWNRRKLITITGSTNIQTDYQMKLTVHKSTGTDTSTDIYLGANVKDDFSDLRFTSNDGSTLLSYWIESITGSTPYTATVWIKIPSIPIGPCTMTIYTYYNNQSATTTSTVIPTFIREIPNVVGAWKLNEQTGTLADSSGNNNNGTVYSTNLNDLSGNNNHGTIIGATRVTGKIGQALSFNGSSDYVNCGNGASLNITTAAIEAWIYPTEISGATQYQIASKYTSGNYWNLALNGGSGTPFAVFQVSGTNNKFILTTNIPSINTWWHIVGTYDGLYAKIYINNTLLNTLAWTGNMDTNSGVVRIGSIDGTGQLFKGLIDNVLIYNRTLSPAEIATHYNSGNGLISDPATETGLVGYWRMGTTDGMTIPGKFGNALKFDGIDDYIDVPPNYNFSAPISISTWVKTAYDIAQVIFSIGKSSDTTIHQDVSLGEATISLTNELITLGRLSSGHRLGYTTTTRTQLFDGNWHHIVATYSGSTAKIYLDGQERTISVGQGSNDGIWGGLSGVDRTTIGAYRLSSASTFVKGVIESFHIYNRTLTQAEVTDIYNNYGYTTTNYAGKELVRKYISPEPTFLATGTEQTAPNITATSMIIIPSENPCRVGICTVTIVVRWSNNGGTDGTVIPNIKIDTISQIAHASRTVIAGSYIDDTFTISDLSAGIHTICPDPN